VFKQRLPNRKPNTETPPSSQERFQAQLQSLLEQQKYRQALETIDKIRRSEPNLIVNPSEAEIWLLRGKQEFEKADFKAGENSLRRALQLGLTGETHYWLAKCLLERNRLDTALELLGSAFAQESLPKEYSICYAKLLLLKGDRATVEELIKKQSKRFTAAQLHWLRGVLALQSQQPETALAAFQKVKQPLTPGDRPDIWQVYTLQCLGDWETAALKLGLGLETSQLFGFSSEPPKYNQHPYLQRLALLQKLKTGQPSIEKMRFRSPDKLLGDIINVLALIQLLEEKDTHEAGHALLKLDSGAKRFPELASLRPTILTLAGQQSFDQQELECAELFWKPLLTEQPFNPQLAANLIEVLEENESYQERQRLLTRTIKWLEKEGKQNPQNWTQEKLNLTLADARCRLADTWLGLRRYRAAVGEVKQAERLCPQSPEVLGRLGLIASIEERPAEATELLTQALEGGCRKEDVYDALVEAWEELGNREAAQEARRRFGKHFGDNPSEANAGAEVPSWLDALSAKSYLLFSGLVQSEKNAEPPMSACQIFVAAAQGEPNSGERVSLDQTEAVEEWEALLQGLSAKEQAPILQAIAISILLFAKREKGIAALITKYLLKLYKLGSQQPEARETYLIVLSLKERDSQKLQIPLRSYLDTMPQPGNALAEIQLKLRRFRQTTARGILSSFIEEALRREPQNPLLLLAKATTYRPSHPEYEEFKQQGFELARRLQDARALQAFREEQTFLNAQEMQEIFPNSTSFDDFDPGDMDALLERLILKMFGSKMPPDELKRMLPELKEMIRGGMPDFDNYDDDDDDDDDNGGGGFGFGFGFPIGGSRKSKKSKRK
jgi:tetratricopeptide (TPR) repeat protein